jgi:uncharacterized membrane protein
MQTSPTQSRRLRDYTSTPLEVFISAFTVIPFFVLAYFYQSLFPQVPLFLNLSGEVETWAEKSVLSVFRVPLLALITQVALLIVKYGTVQSKPVALVDITAGQTNLQDQYLRLSIGLWDWFRSAVAFKMIAESLHTIFLSIDRFKHLARPVFIMSAIGAGVGVVGALVYLYQLLVTSREMKAQVARVEEPVNAQHVYGGVLYFNPSDSALFVSKHIFNFGNKWAWVLIASIIVYPLLVFWPV